jgi:hypothetical protein
LAFACPKSGRDWPEPAFNAMADRTANRAAPLTTELFGTAGVRVAWKREQSIPIPQPPAILSNARSPQEWEALIQGAWQKETGRILEVGKLLLQAREQLLPAVFKALRLPFKARMAQMLAKIAANLVLADPANHGSLPPCWRTLYELTKVPSHELRSAIETGVVHPGMHRKDVDSLRWRGLKKAQSSSGVDETRTGNEKMPLLRWKEMTPEQQAKYLDRIGAAALLAAMSPALHEEIAARDLGHKARSASASSSLAVNLTQIMRHALSADDSTALLELARIKSKLKSNGLTYRDVMIALLGDMGKSTKKTKKRK